MRCVTTWRLAVFIGCIPVYHIAEFTCPLGITLTKLLHRQFHAGFHTKQAVHYSVLLFFFGDELGK